ncbi:MAG: GIY-YIG nuclease family protein [Candidatus Tectomicrobia bacterium]|uniref:GIY-YIG nuclease family protein n=1 Tax=Tectimicrobiota bacterium TaxID=2528274 RepID=A0A933LQG7_UNCTE|nr:GIY-YIG nuclease family protein [Candidatus Tectomicrobia bacterium]
MLVNPAMKENILKIGKTRRSSEERALELSRNSGVPIEFLVAYEEKMIDCDVAEAMVHERLKKFRLNAGREFFCVPLKVAIQVIQKVANELITSHKKVSK